VLNFYFWRSKGGITPHHRVELLVLTWQGGFPLLALNVQHSSLTLKGGGRCNERDLIALNFRTPVFEAARWRPPEYLFSMPQKSYLLGGALHKILLFFHYLICHPKLSNPTSCGYEIEYILMQSLKHNALCIPLNIHYLLPPHLPNILSILNTTILTATKQHTSSPLHPLFFMLVHHSLH